jgi:hypothetical protein
VDDDGRLLLTIGQLAAGVDTRSDRYHELLAVINGQQARPSRTPELQWLLAAIDSHPA